MHTARPKGSTVIGMETLGKESVTKYGVPYFAFVLCISPIQVHTHSS